MEPAEFIPFNKKDVARHNIYLFIAELLGVKKAKNEQSKANKGEKFYNSRKLHDIDNLDDLHENIWLERIYDELDRMNNTIGNFHWTVPLELDCSAQMLQGISALTGDKKLGQMTNVLGKRLDDPWSIDGVPRDHVKKALTPLLYGSAQTITKLWKKNKKEYTREQLQAVSKELRSGKYKLARLLKEFILENVKPKPVMNIKLWGQEFTIECNKFRNVGDYVVRYNIYDTGSDTVRTIYHTHTKKVPDLEQMTRFFQTLLLHGLDSVIVDDICLNINWIISIHDAVLVGPLTASTVRKLYANKLENLNKNRNKVLREYFESIGITGDGKWQLFVDTVLAEADTSMKFKVQPTAMK
jgi:hypothetical protein